MGYCRDVMGYCRYVMGYGGELWHITIGQLREERGPPSLAWVGGVCLVNAARVQNGHEPTAHPVISLGHEKFGHEKFVHDISGP